MKENNNNDIYIKIKYNSEYNIDLMPKYQTIGSAGFDLRSNENYTLKANEIYAVSTGLYMEIPEGYEGQVRSRSGLAIKGICVFNSPGTIDSDYRGEIKIILYNAFKTNFEINIGDRIAQMVINKYQQVKFFKVDNVEKTNRDINGFGSTGIK